MRRADWWVVVTGVWVVATVAYLVVVAPAAGSSVVGPAFAASSAVLLLRSGWLRWGQQRQAPGGGA